MWNVRHSVIVLHYFLLLSSGYATHLKHSLARYHVEVDETVQTGIKHERSKVRFTLQVLSIWDIC